MNLPLDGLTSFPSVLYAALERSRHPPYDWSNRRRRPRGTIVLQRTVTGHVVLETAEGPSRVTPGQAMLFIYGEKTRYFLEPDSGWPYTHQYVVLSPRGGISELVSQVRSDFGDVIQMADGGVASGILGELAALFTASKPRDQLVTAEMAIRLFLSLYREQLSNTERSDPVSFLRYKLETLFRNPLNINQFTSDIPLSREHLIRSFHTRYGETPAACLRRYRLNHAHKLAGTTQLSADEIARVCGFSNTQTLRRAFRKRFGKPLGSIQP